jgi:hypothetical protein
MVVFYLTNTALDIASGVIWWVTKNTLLSVYYGGKYMIYGSSLRTLEAYAALPEPENKESLKKQIALLNEKIDQLSPDI